MFTLRIFYKQCTRMRASPTADSGDTAYGYKGSLHFTSFTVVLELRCSLRLPWWPQVFMVSRHHPAEPRRCLRLANATVEEEQGDILV